MGEKTRQLLAPQVEVYLKAKNKIHPNYKKFYDLIGFQPHKVQQEILDAYFGGEFSVMSLTLARRTGKSFVTSFIATVELMIPNSTILLFSPTFSNAQAIYVELEKNILKLGVKIVSKNSKALSFTLENSSTIFVVTSKSYKNVLGKSLNLVIFEEAQDIENVLNIWENFILPAQADIGESVEGYSNSKTLFIGTARDKSNDLYTTIKRVKDPKYKGYVNFTYKTSDNPYISKAFLEARKAEMDTISFKREFESIWSEQSGELIYYAFSREKNVISHQELLSKLPKFQAVFIAAIDAGFTDNTGYLLAYVEKFTGVVYVIEEYKAAQMPMSHHQKSFHNIEQKYYNYGKVKDRYIDPSAAQMAHDLAIEYKYYTTPAYNKIDEGIKAVNNAFHQQKLFISDNCVGLIDEIESLYWQNAQTKTVRKTKEHKHFDLSLATLRYLYATWNYQKVSDIIQL